MPGALPAADITELLRACLKLLELPARERVYRPNPSRLWRVPDALAHMRRLLARLPADGVPLERLLPTGGEAASAALQRRAVGVLSELAPAALELGAVFRDAGHELALVGGPVRDAFLGRVSADLDFATSATPDETEALLAAWGDAHWDIGKAFGTIGALRWREGREVVVEVTTYRTDA